MTFNAPGHLTGTTPIFVDVFVEVEDGAGCKVQDVVPFEVNNTAPQAINDTFTVSVGEIVNISDIMGLLANDPKIAGATLTASLVTNPSNAISSGPNGFRIFS